MGGNFGMVRRLMATYDQKKGDGEEANGQAERYNMMMREQLRSNMTGAGGEGSSLRDTMTQSIGHNKYGSRTSALIVRSSYEHRGSDFLKERAQIRQESAYPLLIRNQIRQEAVSGYVTASDNAGNISQLD